MNDKRNNIVEIIPSSFSNNNRLFDLINNYYNKSHKSNFFYNKNEGNIKISNRNNKTKIENNNLNKTRGFGLYKQKQNLTNFLETYSQDKFHRKFFSMNFGDLKSNDKNLKNLLNSMKEISLDNIKYGQFITIGNKVIFSVEDI